MVERRRGRLMAATLVVVASLEMTAPAAASTTAPSASPKTIAYVNGTSISWHGQLLPVSGTVTFPPPLDSTYLGGGTTGVAGGPAGIDVVGWDGGSASAASWTSADGGRTWTEHLLSGRPATGTLVARHGLLVSYDDGLRASTDGGATWGAPNPALSLSTGLVAAGLGGFVAMAHAPAPATTRAWSSTDGIVWRQAAASGALRGLCPESIAAGPTAAVALGTTCESQTRLTRLVVTTDGRTWRAVTVPPGMHGGSLSYVSGRYLAIGPYGAWPHDGTAVWVSTNGLAWIRRSYLPRVGASADQVGSVVRYGTGWLAVGYGNADAGDCSLRVWKTGDLVHWYRMSLPATGYPGDYCTRAVQAAVTGGRVVVVGNSSGLNPDAPLVWVGQLTTP